MRRDPNDWLAYPECAYTIISVRRADTGEPVDAEVTVEPAGPALIYNEYWRPARWWRRALYRLRKPKHWSAYPNSAAFWRAEVDLEKERRWLSR